MPSSLRRTLVALLFVLLASWAWHPLFGNGLRGDERSLVEALTQVRTPAQASALHALDGHPLGVAASAWYTGLWADSSDATLAVAWRAHNALLLLLAAWLLGRFARRLCEPWIGAELARAAGWASSMLFALHPLSVAALGSLRAGALLWCLAFAFASLWCYLRGRQERDARLVGSAAALCVAAGLTHGAALAMPLWLAGAEYAAAARRRAGAVKLRSTLAVAAGGALCLTFDSLVRSLALGALHGPRELHQMWASLGSPLEFAATAVERLGMLWLSVNSHVLGAPGFALAGAAALAMLHPMLGAARAAPRLWGWILAGFVYALASTELLGGRSRVHPLDWSEADTMLVSAAAAAAAGAVAITSRSGWSRILLPALVAVLYSTLGHFNARAYAGAAREVAVLARQLRERDERPILLDAPALSEGVRAFEGGPWRCADADSFAAWLASPHSRAERERGARWLRRRPSPQPGGDAIWSAASLRAPAAAAPAVSWLREGRSPALASDPLSYGALLVSFEGPVDPARPLVMAWRTQPRAGREEQDGRCEGVWSELGETPEACFDLERELDWLASDEVRLIWSESGWGRIDSAQLAPRLPAPGVEPEPVERHGAWEFALRGAPGADIVEREYVLVVTDLERLEATVLPAERTATALRVPAAAALMEGMRARGATSIVWALEGRVGGRAVERVRGATRR